MLHVAALLLPLLPLPALGLHLEPTPNPRHMKSRGQRLPYFDVFNQQWRRLAQQERPQVAPVPGVRLLMGVFTTREEADYCRTIRDTWMKQAGVCKVSQGPQASCSVYVTFVQGVPAAEDTEHDTMVLPISESMDNGKSFEFFRNAAQWYPWATHYVKMDTDAYPHLTFILKSLRGRPGCEAYLGRPWMCKDPKDGCPSTSCGPPVDGDFLRYAGHGPEDRCSCYMQGGLYIISRGLLQAALEGDYWQKNSVGFEDVRTGNALAEAAYSKNLCVDTWNNSTVIRDMSFHYGTPPDPFGSLPGWSGLYS